MVLYKTSKLIKVAMQEISTLVKLKHFSGNSFKIIKSIALLGFM